MPKKQAVMVGRTLAETANLDKPDDVDDGAMQRTALRKENNTSQELSTVLDSLSRLADLEKRISGLEKENQYDTMVSKEKPRANE
ncbi:hypothetical protein B484DRAFT_409909, partial [Ochromonadaceae sp. CCMP2298]